MQEPKTGDLTATDRLVDEFFDHILVRDSGGTVVGSLVSKTELDWVMRGMKPPTMSDRLREFIAGHWNSPDGAALMTQLRSQWRTRLGDDVKKSAVLAFREREKSLSPVDQMKLAACEPNVNPTEATLVAKMYLNGTFDTAPDPKYALHLLVEAADHGNAEAAYLLATSKIPLTEDKMGLRCPFTKFLLEDNTRRQQYLRQAREARFRKVFDDEDREQMYEEIRNDEPLSEQLKFDYDYIRLEEEYADNLKKAQSGDPFAQCAIAGNLLARSKHLMLLLLFSGPQYQPEISHLNRREETERQTLLARRHAMKEEARAWLLKASNGSTEARYTLAQEFSETEDEKFSLLLSSAVPEDGLTPCHLALSPLACEFYMNPASKRYDTVKGLKCLDDYLGLYPSIPLDLDVPYLDEDTQVSWRPRFGTAPEDAKAALCLADYHRNQSPPSDKALTNAYIWYSAVGCNVPNAAYAALQAGLMELRSEGCEKNISRVRELFEIARDARSSLTRDIQASKYADVALRLGFELPAHGRLATDQLLELAEDTNFEGDADCPVLPADVALLTKENPHLEDYRNHREELRGYRTRIEGVPGPYGVIPLYPAIAEGMVWTLQPDLEIPRKTLADLWGDESSMVENYAWSRLEMNGRLTSADGEEQESAAEMKLQETLRLGERVLGDKNAHAPAFADRETALRIMRRAGDVLDTQRKLREISLKATKQVEIERAREQTQRDMLSYLTHTLNNTFSGRPQAARQAMEILGSDLYENNSGYTAINNIATMLSTFLFAQQLVNTFKLYIADPQALRNNWDMDREGEASVTTVLAIALRQTLSQLVFAGNHLSALKRLLFHKETTAIKNTRKSFMNEMIPIDVDAGNAQLVYDWVQAHLGSIRVAIDPQAELHFQGNSTRFTFFFASFSELIYNALKYSDAAHPIEVTWARSGGAYTFRCVNSWSEDSIRSKQGSDKGLVFLDRLVQMLGASLKTFVTENRFVAEISFPEHLLRASS